KPLRETLLEFEAEENINCVDFEALKVLKNVLEPVDLAVKNLSKEDATLLSADVIIKFMLQKLSDIDHEISRTLHDNIKRHIDDLASRLFCVVDDYNDDDEEKQSETLSNDAEERTIEFVLFKNTGKRTDHLLKLNDALLSIKPTSTDMEHVFSVNASFCTKIRSRLSDKSLNALVFLNFFISRRKYFTCEIYSKIKNNVSV
ncbi:hypothetical protein ACJMK2_009520, partial [Sinanodonta woodiana]